MNGSVDSSESQTESNDRQEEPRHLQAVTRGRIRSNGDNRMTPIVAISATVALLVLGFAAPAYARQDKQDEKAKPQKQEQPADPEKQQQAKPEQQQQHAQQQAKGQQEQRQKQQDKSAKQEQQITRGQQDQQRRGQQQQQDNAARQVQQQDNRQQQQRSEQQGQLQPARMQSQQERQRQEGEQRGAWQERRAKNWQSEHRNWQQRGGYNGYRIPEDRYNGYFGSGHSFRIYSYPVMMVGGYPRFQYGGYWFAMVDPWPEYWSDNWYDNDDVYIDYSDGGYYLYNRRYPRDRITVEVYLN